MPRLNRPHHLIPRRTFILLAFVSGLVVGAATQPFAGGANALTPLLSEEEQNAMDAATLMAIASIAVDAEIAARGLAKVRENIAALERRIAALEKKDTAIPAGR